MKAAVITRHAVANYGSILQTYATQRFLLNNNIDSYIINYIRNDEYDKNIVKTMLKRNKRWNKNSITRFIYRVIQKKSYVNSFRKFNKFRNNYLRESKFCYHDIDDFKNHYPIADVYISGSDQIWGKIGEDDFDENYFLNFVKEKANCISISSSFGLNNISDNLSKRLKELLRKYSFISVREEKAKRILDENGIKCQVTLDPTLILTKEEWNEFISDQENKYVDYVVVYQLHNNSEILKKAKMIAKKFNKKLLVISANSKKTIGHYKYLYLPDPKLFLACIRDSFCVITDSFHATVFSLIFNKNFVVFPPEGTSSRITDLLNRYDLERKTKFDIEKICEKIDYKKINECIMDDRNKTIKNIMKALNNIKVGE